MTSDWVTEGLIQRGMPAHIAAAFAWNGMDESRLDPGINEANPTVAGSRGGFGAMQWTGPRRRALEGFAQDRGASPSDKDTQLDFLMAELRGPEASAWGKISSAPDTPTAAAAVLNSFLRPAEDHRKKREAKYLGGNTGYRPSGQNPLGQPMQQPKQQPLAQPQQQQPQQNQLAQSFQPFVLNEADFMNRRNPLAVRPI